MKERNKMKQFLIVSIFIISVASATIYYIENEFILNLINTSSLATGFVSFFISIYIIDYTDDIKAQMNEKNNRKETAKYLETTFQENREANEKIIADFLLALRNDNIGEIITYKNDMFDMVFKYKIILNGVSTVDFNLNTYISRLEDQNFNVNIHKPGNKNFFKKNTMLLETAVATLYLRFERSN